MMQTKYGRLVEKNRSEVQHTIRGCCQHIHSLRHGVDDLFELRNEKADYLRSKPGQGGDADTQPRDLRAQLLEAEAAHFSKTDGTTTKPASTTEPTTSSKRQLEAGPGDAGDGEEDIEAKRRKVLEETRHIDADSDDPGSSSSEEDRYCH